MDTGLYDEILSGAPSKGTLFLVLSRMKRSGMLERVMEECEKVLMTYPDDIRFRRLLAEACFEAGMPGKAEKELDEVIARINELMTCYRFQADVFISEGKKDEAVGALKLYLIHCPDDKESYALLESLQPGEEIPGTVQEKQVAEQGHTDAVPEKAGHTDGGMSDIATPTLAEVYFNQARTREAIETYEKVVELHPDDAGSALRLGELKAMEEHASTVAEKERDRVLRKKKVVSILESWLQGIREQSKTRVPAG